MKFLRRTSNRYSKLGKGRKKKQIWRRPTGRDNKMREKRRGYPARVSVGYKTEIKNSGNLKGKTPVLVKNINELENLKQNQIAIIGKMGKKKKIELSKKAKELKISFYNINIKIFLKQNEKTKGTKKKAEEKKEIKPGENKK